ncbi:MULTISPECIES: transposase [Paraburkholderia]|uniref:transposase n=1 Tax=Paraburkholderia TaxID=1822464 RepID=UPI00224DE3FE|nr:MULTISPECIES: transposase [Paraburkholderia]MCX4165377.1 transposase [Paraburkholderia megapolitana]MDN7160869.1 transposase [Paraburkholderia sp. CHISQ3]MDQ6497916.1 transposase [Paraburkholderia megapolitana]
MPTLPLSDDAWSQVRHLFPYSDARRFGRASRDPREVLNAVLWVVTQRERWQHLPADYPPSQTCYIKWLQWTRAGIMSEALLLLDLYSETEQQLERQLEEEQTA